MEQGRVGKRGLQVMVWAVVLAAVGVSMASLQQAPIYEAVARVMVERAASTEACRLPSWSCTPSKAALWPKRRSNA